MIYSLLSLGFNPFFIKIFVPSLSSNPLPFTSSLKYRCLVPFFPRSMMIGLGLKLIFNQRNSPKKKNSFSWKSRELIHVYLKKNYEAKTILFIALKKINYVKVMEVFSLSSDIILYFIFMRSKVTFSHILNSLT